MTCAACAFPEENVCGYMSQHVVCAIFQEPANMLMVVRLMS